MGHETRGLLIMRNRFCASKSFSGLQTSNGPFKINDDLNIF